MDGQKTPLAGRLSRDLGVIAVLAVVGICLLTEPLALVNDFLLSGLHSTGVYGRILAFALVCGGAAVVLGRKSRRGDSPSPGEGWRRDTAELGIALGFGSLAAVVIVLILGLSSEPYVVVAIAGVALVLPFAFSKHRSRRTMWAVGVATVAVVASATIPVVSYEPFAVLVMVGAVFIFLRKLNRHPVWAVMAAVILAGLAALCLGVGARLFPGSYAEVNWAIGISGCFLLALSPGRVLFGCSQPARRRLLTAGLLYILTLAVAWQMWAGFGWIKEQIRLRELNRARASIRNLGSFLETYYIDHSLYPPPSPERADRKTASTERTETAIGDNP